MHLEKKQWKSPKLRAIPTLNLNEINALTPSLGLQLLFFFYFVSPFPQGGAPEVVLGAWPDEHPLSLGEKERTCPG